HLQKLEEFKAFAESASSPSSSSPSLPCSPTSRGPFLVPYLIPSTAASYLALTVLEQLSLQGTPCPPFLLILQLGWNIIVFLLIFFFFFFSMHCLSPLRRSLQTLLISPCWLGRK
ncbi:hypothetical protein XELAEV_18040317mg, partial [Xenopus laevis]